MPRKKERRGQGETAGLLNNKRSKAEQLSKSTNQSFK